ncbi:MAG: acetyl-CoA carboxylase biotin carboxyl carrier protein [Clostridiales bacterium]|jgi:acetyl-CoA carboxylase biotin carboxyl carrier protein|nr:acetyl-CoA carboxylase biotin carboxyl carrier protein [Clostridiales bacterium]
MELKKIKELAKILKEYDLNVIDISEGDSKIRLEKSANCAPQETPQPAVVVPPVTEDSAPQEVDFNEIKEIKSPMVGVFYQAPSPDSPPYVKIGDKIKKGDVLCIIEAMKLMNEIVAEFDGEIVDICAKNGEIVEYGQTLFKVF